MKDSRRLPGDFATQFGLFHLSRDFTQQPWILRQSEQIKDVLLLFAPRHNFFVAETAVAAQHDFRLRPTLANRRHYSLHFGQHAVPRALVRRPQPRAQQIVATKNVERQVNLIVVIAVKMPPFLLPMHAVVGRIQIEIKTRGNPALRAEKLSDKEFVHRRRIHRDLLVNAIALFVSAPQFKTIERALASQGLALIHSATTVLTSHIHPPAQQSQERVYAQLVVIVEVFVPQRQAEDALFEQLLDTKTQPPTQFDGR